MIYTLTAMLYNHSYQLKNLPDQQVLPMTQTLHTNIASFEISKCCTTTSFQCSFFNRTVWIWNSLGPFELLARIQVLGEGVQQRGHPSRGKCDFYHSDAKSVCFNLVMNILHLKLTVFISYFYKFLTLAVLM